MSRNVTSTLARAIRSKVSFRPGSRFFHPFSMENVKLTEVREAVHAVEEKTVPRIVKFTTVSETRPFSSVSRQIMAANAKLAAEYEAQEKAQKQKLAMGPSPILSAAMEQTLKREATASTTTLTLTKAQQNSKKIEERIKTHLAGGCTPGNLDPAFG